MNDGVVRRTSRSAAGVHAGLAGSSAEFEQRDVDVPRRPGGPPYRLGLTAKISVLAVLNFVLLGVVFAAFLRLELRQDMGSFLMAAGRERILAVSRQVALDLEETAAADRDSLLARYGAANGVKLYLFLNDGVQLAGDKLKLPEPVEHRLRGPGGPGGPGQGPGGPPPPLEEGSKPPALLPAQGSFFVSVDAPLHYWIGVRIPVREKSSPGIGRGTLLIASSSLLGNPFFFQIKPWLAILAMAALISILCWLPLVRGLTRSIGAMLETTAKIGEGRFDAQSGVRRRDELGELSDSINSMAAQLDSLVRGQKRFLADAAHELRSPLGRMQLALELLERQHGEAGAEYLGDLREDIELMSNLAGELLALARAETLGSTAPLSPVALAEVLAKAVKTEGGAAEIQVETPPDLNVLGQQALLYRCFSNIIRNSVRYAGQAGPIVIRADAVNGDVHITFADSGPGVPEEALEKLFTPFYRTEESRNRLTGGAGLGLAIVKSCAEACHGTVECRNRRPSGLETILRLRRA
jgi:two-component system sensor histidine kinase CpxA